MSRFISNIFRLIIQKYWKYDIIKSTGRRFTMTIGDRLKIARENAGLKQIDVKRQTNINNKTLSNWENNVSNPSPEDLRTLSKLYNVTIDSLVGNEKLQTNTKKPKELIQLIEQEDYTLNGQVATPEDREKLAKIIEALYWDAKEKNKRKK